MSYEDKNSLETMAKISSVQLPNPFILVQTIKEAEQLSGISLAAPAKLPGHASSAIYVVKNELIQLIYYTKDEEDRVILRKAKGSVENLSGHYEVYTEHTVTDAGGCKITLKTVNNRVKIATWQTSQATYSLDYQSGTDRLSVMELVQKIY